MCARTHARTHTHARPHTCLSSKLWTGVSTVENGDSFISSAIRTIKAPKKSEKFSFYITGPKCLKHSIFKDENLWRKQVSPEHTHIHTLTALDK